MVSSLPEALRLAGERGETEVFIGGGGSIYAQALAVADRIYMTRVHVVVEADVVFPAWDDKEWCAILKEELMAAEGASPACTFTVYERGRAGSFCTAP